MSNEERLQIEYTAMYNALQQLIAAKDYKTNKGKDATYKAMALEAWEAARDAVYLADIRK